MKKYGLFTPLLAILIFCSCQKPKDFEYRDIRNIKIQQLGLDKTNLTIDLVYYNPNSFGVNLKKINCDVYIDKNYLGNFKLDTSMHISKQSEFAITTNMIVNMQSIYKNALSSLLGKEVLISVKGSAKVGRAGIFINIPFNYEVKHKLKLF